MAQLIVKADSGRKEPTFHQQLSAVIPRERACEEFGFEHGTPSPHFGGRGAHCGKNGESSLCDKNAIYSHALSRGMTPLGVYQNDST
jgi:hypothetical protein